MWPFDRKPKEPEKPWVYLGWQEVSYHTKEEPEVQTNAAVLHFYARGEELKERKVDFVRHSYIDWEAHRYYQQAVVPWLNGNSLWGPIEHPSEDFKDWTEEHHGYKHKDGKWYKPVQEYESENNILVFPKSGGE